MDGARIFTFTASIDGLQRAHLDPLEAAPPSPFATTAAAATTRAMSCSGVSVAVPATPLRWVPAAAPPAPPPTSKLVRASGPRSSTTARSYARAASSSASKNPRWWICAERTMH